MEITTGRILCAAALALLACQRAGGEKPGRSGAPAPAPQGEQSKGKPMKDVAKIDWNMNVVNGGKTLRIDYKVTNTSDRRFYLADLLPVPGPKLWALGRTAIIVMNDREPDTVAFVRGRVASETPLPVPLDPGARSIDPGQTQAGTAEVPLPLRAQHYRGTVAPLKGTPKQAVLEIGYLDDAHWTELPLDDGTRLTTSSPADPMQVLRSDRKPIPQK